MESHLHNFGFHYLMGFLLHLLRNVYKKIKIEFFKKLKIVGLKHLINKYNSSLVEGCFHNYLPNQGCRQNCKL